MTTEYGKVSCDLDVHSLELEWGRTVFSEI